MWAYESTFYQIYPLGFCGAPLENDGKTVSRIQKVKGWIPHLLSLGIDAVYFGPIFESDTHGYNTRDYTRVDCRLGTDADFADVAAALHGAGIRVVLDGVFNHVGRGFPPFQDVLHRREASEYVDWFARIDFGGNSPYGDGLWYEGWEGNYDLVKLNLRNEAVIQYLFHAVGEWIRRFDIDGIRLDVAYMLDRDFLRRLREFCDGCKQDFFLVGEVLHGEYGRMLREMNLHSVTNYQCYKGLYSAFNSANLFEIVHSLARLFGPEDWTVCRDAHLLSFCDNHDVSRIATITANARHLPMIYAMLFGMPGIPCIYYGSEWGAEGDKSWGDPALRPCFDAPRWNELTEWIAALSRARKNCAAFAWGGFRSVVLTGKACIFERRALYDSALVCINMDDKPVELALNMGSFQAEDLITGQMRSVENRVTLPPCYAGFWRLY